MSGINALTGHALDGFDHALQSFGKLLTTPLGSRVMRPWVGNPGLRLLGENMTEENILRWCVTIWALAELFEPRLKIAKFEPRDLTRTGDMDMAADVLYRPYGHLDFVQAQAFISFSNGTLLIRSGV